MIFRVYGRVQGVFMRKYTEEKANALGLVGWSRNVVPDGFVEGEVEGPRPKLEEMRQWLSLEGSPQSEIEKCEVEFEPLKDGLPVHAAFVTAESRRTDQGGKKKKSQK